MVPEVFAAALMNVAVLQGDLAENPVVHQTMTAMVSQVQNGLSHVEAAAFIVRDETGDTRVIEWPSSGLPDSAMWAGPIPKGAIAIAHTHPNWQPRPSRIDISTARLAKMPVYVVTRTQVWKTAAGVAFRIE